MATSSTRDYYRITWTGNGDLSPDGRLFARTRTHVEEPDVEVSEVVLRDRSTGAEEVVAQGFDPQFSPEGARLLYLRREEGAAQLFLLDLASRTERRLTRMRFGAASPVWAPDGAHVAFCSRVDLGCDPALWGRPATEAERAAEERRRVEHPYMVTEAWSYKSDEDGGFSTERAWTLWSVAVPPAGGGVSAADEKEAAAPRLLSDGSRDHVMPAFSADGARVVFASNRARPREEAIAYDLFSVPVAGGAMERLTQEEWVAYYPAAFQPLVAADGRFIVFGALEPDDDPMGNMPLTRLYRLDLAPDGRAAGAPRSLWPADAPCHEATCFVYNCENEGLGSRVTGALSADGAWVYFVSGWHGAANLYRASADPEAPRIEALTAEDAVWRSVRACGGEVLASRGSFTETPQLFSAPEAALAAGCGAAAEGAPAAAAFARLTAENLWFEGVLSEPRELWIDCLDGAGRVQGWVFPPQGAREPGHRFPAVVYVHGGPTPMMSCALTYEHQCILGAGMGLLILNPRGSSGYGGAHQSMEAAYDGRAATDILQFVDEACRRFDWIDPERIGLTGGSYGGWMTNWLLGHTKRFKAGVTQRSIANEVIEYASSDMPGSSEGWESYTDYLADALRRSPVSCADKIDAPFLILHGMDDMRCPVYHAHQLFSAVKETHPEGHVKMVLFPGMTHGFPMEGPMDLRLAHYDAMIDWFQTYL